MAEQQEWYYHEDRDPARCPKDGGEHQWDGEPAYGPDWGSVTCSKCGAAAIDVDMRIAP